MADEPEYILTSHDIPTFEYGSELPVIRAAGNPDSRVLRAILKQDKPEDPDRFHFSCHSMHHSYDGRQFNSPLIQAVTSQLPKNVEILLQAGADPNGMIIEGLQSYALRFVRFRDWDDGKYCEEHEDYWNENSETQTLDQSCPITEGERAKRWRGIQRFWTEHDLVPLDFEKNGDVMPALVAAAKFGNIKIFDRLHKAGADASFWFSNPKSLPKPDVTLSSLAVSTPLHAALAGGHHDMLDHLLDLGFDPNCQPLTAISQCITPLMATLASSEPNTYAFSKLIRYPVIDVQARTPVYRVHVLHFLVARHELVLLHNVTKYIHLNTAGITALGHTLLHVACLPLNDKHIQIFAPKCYASIHEVRSLSCSWRPQWLSSNRRNNTRNTGSWNDYNFECTETRREYSRDDVFPCPTPEFLVDQTDTVLFLMLYGAQELAAEDMYGNTALHYLAGHRVVNEPLLSKLKAMTNGWRVWKNCKNHLGHTPRDLWNDGRMAIEEPNKKFWISTARSYYDSLMD